MTIVEDLLGRSAVLEDTRKAGAALRGALGKTEPKGDSQSLMQRIVEYAAGESRREFEFPELGTSGPQISAFSTPGMALAGAYAAFVDPKQVADIAVKVLPGASQSEDRYGNAIVRFNGQNYYINRPGMSVADFYQGLGQAGLFGPAARAGATARTLAGRVAKTGSRSAATSVGLDIGAGWAGSDEGIDWGRAGVTGVFSGLMEGVAPVAKMAWRSIFRDKRFFANGAFTPRGRAVAESAELNPDYMTSRLQKMFAKEVADEPIPGAAAARVATAEHGIPYTRGQQTRNLTQLGREESIRHGAAGGGGMEVMQAFDKRQQTAMTGAVTKASGLTMARPGEAGQIVGTGLTRKAEAFSKRIDDAYATLRSMDATADPRALPNLAQSMRRAVADFDLDQELFPATNRSVRLITEISEAEEVFSLKAIETTRRKLGLYIGAAKNKSDKLGAVRAKEAFDEWIDDTVDARLFSGDEGAIAQLKQAIGLRREYGKMFEPHTRGDEAGQFIQKVISEDRTGEEVINWIFGKARLGSKGTSARAALRLKTIFGDDSLEFGALREAAWMKLAYDNRGNLVSPGRFVSNIDEIFQQNRSLLEVLFSADEQNLIQGIKDAFARTVTPSKVTNPPKTAFSMMRSMRDIIRRAGTQATFRGHAYAGWALFKIGRLFPEHAGARAAYRSVRPLRRPLPTAPGVVATGTAGARLENENTTQE